MLQFTQVLLLEKLLVWKDISKSVQQMSELNTNFVFCCEKEKTKLHCHKLLRIKGSAENIPKAV